MEEEHVVTLLPAARSTSSSVVANSARRPVARGALGNARAGSFTNHRSQPQPLVATVMLERSQSAPSPAPPGGGMPLSLRGLGGDPSGSSSSNISGGMLSQSLINRHRAAPSSSTTSAAAAAAVEGTALLSTTRRSSTSPPNHHVDDDPPLPTIENRSSLSDGVPPQHPPPSTVVGRSAEVAYPPSLDEGVVTTSSTTHDVGQPHEELPAAAAAAASSSIDPSLRAYEEEIHRRTTALLHLNTTIVEVMEGNMDGDCTPVGRSSSSYSNNLQQQQGGGRRTVRKSRGEVLRLARIREAQELLVLLMEGPPSLSSSAMKK